ncbi:MAG: thrombospondin type 3 repeat-containing protein [Myxococcales bacterium]|nr:thrombospondin type 3 repeat-containing protein [Myxococcales bacterium]
MGLCEAGCIALPGDIGSLPDDGSTSMGSGADTDGMVTATDGGEGSADTGVPPSACGPDGPSCLEDQDGDCVGLGEDNAPDVYNPDQSDIDGDGIADPIDSCPSVPSGATDSDHDGLGNECDPCRRAAATYNNDGLPSGSIAVRNVPSIADADGDGIGDACDNCIVTPNCEAYGPGNEWHPGDPIADTDPTVCQGDADDDMVGDACEGLQLPGAAGPVGLAADDDFDQDGLRNINDACPRAPLADAIACASDLDCPVDRRCEVADGLCDHVDVDSDSVGDVCDSCPTVENPLQTALPAMAEAEDIDGDFVGAACEGGSSCSTIVSPARIGFYPVAVEGLCCTVQYPGDDLLLDPDGLPIRLDCDESGNTCRQLPPTFFSLPGVVALPPGCEAALADAGLDLSTHLPLTPGDVGGVDGLWQHSCRLPPLDQDLDGLPDACDLCPLAFDPANTVYIDDGGMVWPDDGKYCNGEYSIDNTCGT